MRPLQRAWNRITGTFAGARQEAELAEEFDAHLQMQTEENIRAGMTPNEARRAAALKFGGIEEIKESYREQRELPGLGSFGRDVRYAVRSLRASPGLALAAILSLALAIGAATAIFSVADAVLLKKLPYSEPERLASVFSSNASSAVALDAIRRNAHTVESAALYVNWSFTLTGLGEPARIPAARVSAGLFEMLGVRPQAGRTFRDDEDQDGSDKVVVIGDALWKTRFHGEAGTVGQMIHLNGVPHRIIGIMPPGFQFPDGPELPEWAGPFPPAQIWRPMALVGWERTCTSCFNFGSIVRLRKGVTAEQARAEIVTILKTATPEQGAEIVQVRTLHSIITGRVQEPVTILFGAVTLALLIACVNVANLLLARGLRRRGEIALRLSLGASRGRIVRQLLTESLVLAACSAALSIPLAWGMVRALLALAPADIPRLGTVALDLRVFGFALTLALLSALLFGLAPAWLASRHAPGEAMKAAGRKGSAGPAKLRGMLIVVEFALSLVLLAAASLLARRFVELAKTQLGFDTESVLTMRLWLPDTVGDYHHRAILAGQMADNCAALPGVLSASVVSVLPLTGGGEGWGTRALDSRESDRYTSLRTRSVTPSYFRTMGIRLIEGREFNTNDRGTNNVAIISRSAARALWPNIPSPLGRRIEMHKETVVGIVEDTRASGVDSEIIPYLYVPFSQFAPEEFALAVRTRGNPMLLAPAAKAEVWRLDPSQAITHVETMEQVASGAIASWRFQAVLMGVFALFALVLAAVGISGVLSYWVEQRTNEIGIRMALGASRWSVVLGVIRQAGSLALAGTAFGVVAAMFATRFMRSLLFDAGAAQSDVLAACAVTLLAVGLAACILPARRAAGLNPTECLRSE